VTEHVSSIIVRGRRIGLLRYKSHNASHRSLLHQFTLVTNYEFTPYVTDGNSCKNIYIPTLFNDYFIMRLFIFIFFYLFICSKMTIKTNKQVQ